jgi:hypothetical protein
VELGASCVNALSSSRVILHVNKVHSVTTIGRIAQDLGEDEDWLWEVANGRTVSSGSMASETTA